MADDKLKSPGELSGAASVASEQRTAHAADALEAAQQAASHKDAAANAAQEAAVHKAEANTAAQQAAAQKEAMQQTTEQVTDQIARAEKAASKEITAKLDKLRVGIAASIFCCFPVLVLFLLAALIFLFWIIRSKDVSGAEKLAVAASVQVAIGMVMGFVGVFIGLMMTWFGINAAFEFSGRAGEKGDVSLKSASPGLLFFLGGIILIGVSLYKKIEYEEPGQIIGRVPVNGKNATVDGVPPGPLPPSNKVEK